MLAKGTLKRAVAAAGAPAGTPGGAEVTRLIWVLGIGALGLAWSITTVAAYLPPVLGQFTSSATLIGMVLAAEGVFAIFLPLVVGPLSDATRTPFGRRRPYLAFAIAPMTLALAMVAFMPNLASTAFALFAFFFAYYIYEPPYRGLYPDLLPASVFGRAQGAQHVMRGVALGAALVGGGVLLGVWEPFPFVLAAGVTAVACSLVIALTREDTPGDRDHKRFRSYLASPWRIVRKEREVRLFLICNTAWEATFAGMRTFVVLYIVDGLGQPLYVSSAVLSVVAIGYVFAAFASGRLGDKFGIARVILGASIVYGLGLTLSVLARQWHWWYYPLIAPVAVAGGMVMTLSWGLLFKLMPARERGAISGLAIMTKGIGLLLGPLAVGAVIDIFHPLLRSTDGYAAMWPAVGIPVLLVVPIVVLLIEAEAKSATRTETSPAV
ncbi:MAG: MFS transporter [Thermoleophilia bacterium]|nr:MFS transporter [Thermoleophilia bacterium]